MRSNSAEVELGYDLATRKLKNVQNVLGTILCIASIYRVFDRVVRVPVIE
jgi:hypothetical protein